MVESYSKLNPLAREESIGIVREQNYEHQLDEDNILHYSADFLNSLSGDVITVEHEGNLKRSSLMHEIASFCINKAINNVERDSEHVDSILDVHNHVARRIGKQGLADILSGVKD